MDKVVPLRPMDLVDPAVRDLRQMPPTERANFLADAMDCIATAHSDECVAFLAVEYHGMKVVDVAKVLEITKGAVSKRVSKFRTRLKNEIETRLENRRRVADANKDVV